MAHLGTQDIMNLKHSILSFLERCQNGGSYAANVARFLGFQSSNTRVRNLLYQMRREGLVNNVGYRWQLVRDGSPPSGTGTTEATVETRVVTPVAATTHSPGLRHGRSADAGQATTCVSEVYLATAAPSTVEPRQRRTNGTASSVGDVTGNQ